MLRLAEELRGMVITGTYIYWQGKDIGSEDVDLDVRVQEQSC